MISWELTNFHLKNLKTPQPYLCYSKAKEASPPKEASNAGDQLNEEITAAGNKVRDLKSKKAEKVEIDTAVATLLDLKAKYKAATGKDWKPAQQPSKAKAATPAKQVCVVSVIFCYICPFLTFLLEYISK